MSWINHLPPACWSTFWKSNFKQQLGCRFDIMDNESYFFVFWHMQLYMSWYIRSFFGFTFLNILYFFKYSCTNIFHRRSLYTFYSIRMRVRCIFVCDGNKRIYQSLTTTLSLVCGTEATTMWLEGIDVNWTPFILSDDAVLISRHFTSRCLGLTRYLAACWIGALCILNRSK